MPKSSDKIEQLYSLSQYEFSYTFRARVINLRRQLLADFLISPGNDPHVILAEIARLFVVAQKQISADADITEKQREDFQSRTDKLVADVAASIECCIEKYPDWRSPEFQIACATQLKLIYKITKPKIELVQIAQLHSNIGFQFVLWDEAGRPSTWFVDNFSKIMNCLGNNHCSFYTSAFELHEIDQSVFKTYANIDLSLIHI